MRYLKIDEVVKSGNEPTLTVDDTAMAFKNQKGVVVRHGSMAYEAVILLTDMESLGTAGMRGRIF